MEKINPPRIICLCGSVRFLEKFREIDALLTLEGFIVLSVALSKDSFSIYTDEQIQQLKDDLDWLHKRKIDLADEVFIVNVDGYIGDSTRSEVEYAEKHNKPITYLVKPD